MIGLPLCSPESRDLVGLLHQPFAELPDQPSAIAGRHLAPRAGLRRPRGLDRGVHVGLRGGSDLGNHFFRRRIHDGHRLAARRIAPLAANQ
jgi:hypothetical protein